MITGRGMTLSDVIRTTRRSVFVGRVAEQEWVSEWLKQSVKDTAIVGISGEPGAGKSSLAEMIMDLASQWSSNRLWLDGRVCPVHPAGLWEHIMTMLEVTWGHTNIGEVARDKPCVVALDNYEHLLPVDEWFRHRLLDWLPSENVMWILVQRGRDGFGEWRREWRLHGRFQWFNLGPLSLDESRQLIQNRHGILLPNVIAASGGWPLALTVFVDRTLKQHPVGDVPLEFHAKVIAERFWQEIHDDTLRRTILLLSMLPYATEDQIREVLGDNFTGETSMLLSRVSFLGDTPNGLSIHEMLRPWIRRDGKRRWKEDYGDMQRAILRMLDRRWQTANSAEKLAFGRQMLSVLQEMLPANDTYADLGGMVLNVSEFRSEDTAHLHQFLEQWGKQPLPLENLAMGHQLLDDVLMEVPHLVRVFRDSEDHPRAFFIPFLLHDRLTRIVERYVGSIDDSFDEEIHAYGPIEQADTYFGGLLGVDHAEPLLPNSLLVGTVICEGLSLMAQGTQSYLFLKHPGIIAMVESLGFEPQGTRLPAHEVGHLYRLDLRYRSFAQWILKMANIDIDSPLTDGEMRDVLRALRYGDRQKLEQICQQIGWNPTRVRSRVTGLLESDISDPVLSTAQRELLRDVYLKPSGNIQHIIDAHHVSRATFYRLLRKAEQALLRALL